MIQGPLTASELFASLASYRAQHSWDTSTLSFELPENVNNLIKGGYFPINSHSYDRIIWGLTPNGLFSVKSLYTALNPSHTTNSFLWLWKLQLPPKITHFI